MLICKRIPIAWEDTHTQFNALNVDRIIMRRRDVFVSLVLSVCMQLTLAVPTVSGASIVIAPLEKVGIQPEWLGTVDIEFDLDRRRDGAGDASLLLKIQKQDEVISSLSGMALLRTPREFFFSGSSSCSVDLHQDKMLYMLQFDIEASNVAASDYMFGKHGEWLSLFMIQLDMGREMPESLRILSAQEVVLSVPHVTGLSIPLYVGEYQQ